MSLLFKRELSTAAELIGQRYGSRRGNVTVNAESALAHSAVWACLRLRADLISTLPVDVFRNVGGINVLVNPPEIITQPGGPDCLSTEWRYSSQIDLDRYGNTVGVITAFAADGKPARIELAPMEQATYVCQGGDEFWRINGQRFERSQIWHEKQWTAPGLPIGLSPLAYAAMSIGQYLSAQQFALDWFANGSMPSGKLKNTAKKIDKDDAELVKDRFKASVAARDVFVHGNDWEFDFISVAANESQFLEAMRFGSEDICRFFGVPSRAIDAASPGSGGTVTYANVTQDDLHLLVRNLNPAIVRREEAWSNGLVARPRMVRLNQDALLRLDPQTRQQVLREDVAAKLRTYSEARALMNLPPLTPADMAEFQAVNPAKALPAAPTPNGAPTQ
jgi:HK97 family phage portal protein